MDLEFFIANKGSKIEVKETFNLQLTQSLTDVLQKEASFRGFKGSSDEVWFERLSVVGPKDKVIQKASYWIYRNTRTLELVKVSAGIWYNNTPEERIKYYEFCLDHCREHKKNLVDRLNNDFENIKSFANEKIVELAKTIVHMRIWPSEMMDYYHGSGPEFKQLLRQLDSISFLIESQNKIEQDVLKALDNLKNKICFC